MSSGHLTDEQLEAPGEAPHLKECAECRAAVARAAARKKLLSGLKPYTLADVAFSRVEARLMEHVRENPPGPRWSLGRVLAIAAMAAVAVLFAVSTVQPLVGGRAAPLAAYEPLIVVFASGATSVKAGDALGKETSVDAERGRVRLATGDGEALRLEGSARFKLGQRDAAVRLESGALTVTGPKRGPWVVATPAHWVRVVDATFEVAADQLKVFSGALYLADNAAFERERLVVGPMHVRLTDGALTPLQGPPRKLEPMAPGPWARLQLDLPASEVELDGQKLGPSPLSLLTTPGRHHVRALVGEAWREADVELRVGALGVVELPEKEAVAPPPVPVPVAPTGPAVEADPEAIAAAVKAQLPKLRVCHEKWLKVDDRARGKVVMSLTVSPKGRVTRAAFTAAEGVPPSVNDCLARAVRALKLPRSDEEVELEVPVLLGAQ